MKEKLEEFAKRVPEFNGLTSGEVIPFFIYYLNNEENCDATPKLIEECFDALSLIKYSNIYQYLKQQSHGKSATLIKKENGYTLTRQRNDEIFGMLSDEKQLFPSNELVDTCILKGKPYYIKSIVTEMCCCYDNALYNACLVMMRKLFETLIIECFERYGISDEIKDTNGVFLFLSDLMPHFIHSKKWSLSRNFEKNIKIVKKYGDLSAHNRRFLARKYEIDEFKFELRQCLQEIILIIDYENWNKEDAINV